VFHRIRIYYCRHWKAIRHAPRWTRRGNNNNILIRHNNFICIYSDVEDHYFYCYKYYNGPIYGSRMRHYSADSSEFIHDKGAPILYYYYLLYYNIRNNGKIQYIYNITVVVFLTHCFERRVSWYHIHWNNSSINLSKCNVQRQFVRIIKLLKCWTI